LASVSSAAPTDQVPPQADPDQMPMQPGSSNTPQLRKIESQQDQKKQATPTKTQTAQRGAKKK
jgi:hypothetical protein